MSNIPSPDDRVADRYRIIRLIGEGGMGAVFEAENVITHKRVALKWLHPAVASRADSSQRLIREAQAASRIRHPNVVDVYDVITDQGTIFLVLELLEGEPLHDAIERAELKVPAFIALLLQAMKGVAAAHAHGVIHRDVHPGNIFLENRRPMPGVKVLDFGISKLDGETTHALTHTGTTMGTPMYMSYEQLTASRDLDARADIYSFGVILYRALTGQYPYAADTLTELAVQFVTSKPASVKMLRREIPSALDRLIMACVSRDRELRPASLESLIEELEPFAAEDSFRALLSGQQRQIPLLASAAPVTRAHSDAGAMVPVPVMTPFHTPTSVRPITPAPEYTVPPVAVESAVTRGKLAQPRARWKGPAAFGLMLFALAAGSALITSQLRSPAAMPPLPQAPAVAAAQEAPAASTLPTGVTPPPTPAVPTPSPSVDAPATTSAPVKTKRWVPKQKPKDADEYWRSGGLKPADF